MAKPYELSDAVATTIARLTVHDNMLPFGAPSSPVLSNMICSALDAELTTLGRETGSFYTRYADDIVFSTHRGRFAHQIAKVVETEGARQVLPGDDLERVIKRHGFQINKSKTRLKTRHDSQVVCGVLVNTKLNVRRGLRREIRGMLHAWRAFGSAKVQHHWLTKYGNADGTQFEQVLRGKIEFMRAIRGENDDVVYAAVEQFNNLATGPVIRYDKPLNWKEALFSKICIVFAESEDMNQGSAKASQGSGFVVEGGYILTNAHVVCDKAGNALEKIGVEFADLAVGELPAEILSLSVIQDLALLRVKDAGFAGILAARSLPLKKGAYPEAGETLTLAGYPNFQEGDTLHVAEGHVTGRSKVNDIAVFRISASIIYGNSGGPVLNAKGEVVGVAVCGSGINDAPYTIHNGAIPTKTASTFVAGAVGTFHAGKLTAHIKPPAGA